MYSSSCANPPSFTLCLLCTLCKRCVMLYSVAQILLASEAPNSGEANWGNAYIAAHAVLWRYLWRQQERLLQVLHQEVPRDGSPLTSQGLLFNNNNNFRFKKKKKKRSMSNFLLQEVQGDWPFQRSGVEVERWDAVGEVKMCMCCIMVLFLLENRQELPCTVAICTHVQTLL